MHAKTVLAAAALLCTATLRGEDAYLESDGTQAIDTGYHMRSNSCVVADFSMTETENNTILFGAWNYTGNNRLIFGKQ